MMFWTGAATLLIAALAIVTVAGLFAPLYPPAEMVNHFRPYIFLGCGIVAAAMALAGMGRLTLFAGGLALFNATLLALPVLTSAPAGAASAKAPDFKILSFNVWTNNRDVRQVAGYVLAQNPDVILFQELPTRNAATLVPLLRAAYPHVKRCVCRNMLLLSKRPWIEDGGQPRIRGAEPPLVWARFKLPDQRTVRVIGVHPAYPLRPSEQAADYAWLTDYLAALDEPTIVAGDFNLTPWSYKLNRLLLSARLERHGTLQRSWPAIFAFPAFLIDNVLTTPGFRTLSFTTGPYLGSDHRPIVVRLALP